MVENGKWNGDEQFRGAGSLCVLRADYVCAEKNCPLYLIDALEKITAGVVSIAVSLRARVARNWIQNDKYSFLGVVFFMKKYNWNGTIGLFWFSNLEACTSRGLLRTNILGKKMKLFKKFY